MNFQPSDYLSELNLVFEHADHSPVEESGQSANLDFFSQADFFDLDVFSNDFAAREKRGVTSGLPAVAQLQPHHDSVHPAHHVTVKQEADFGTVAGSLVSHHLSSQEPSAATSPVSSLGGADTTTDEVKRRRNTAASARFRVKKKLKEKEMEQHARDLEARLGSLEKKLRTLEMENKCLRQLIVEKTEKKNNDLLESIKKRSLGGRRSDDGNIDTAFTYTN